jgi:hypothetical protein
MCCRSLREDGRTYKPGGSGLAARIGTTSAARLDRCASFPAFHPSFSGGVSLSTITRRSMSLSRVASPSGSRTEEDDPLRVEMLDHRVEEIARDTRLGHAAILNL